MDRKRNAEHIEGYNLRSGSGVCRQVASSYNGKQTPSISQQLLELKIAQAFLRRVSRMEMSSEFNEKLLKPISSMSFSDRKQLTADYARAQKRSTNQIELLENALRKIYEIQIQRKRSVRHEWNFAQRSGVFTYLEQLAESLPIWMPEHDVECSEPCGNHSPNSYECCPGDLVAVNADVSDSFWILAEVVWVGKNGYEVRDVDPDTKSSRLSVPFSKVIPLPKWRVNPYTQAQFLLSTEQKVLALYPQTTCFYTAYVREVPNKLRGYYTVAFEDTAFSSGLSPPIPLAQIIHKCSCDHSSRLSGRLQLLVQS